MKVFLKKRIIPLILVFSLCFTLVVVPANAASAVGSQIAAGNTTLTEALGDYPSFFEGVIAYIEKCEFGSPTSSYSSGVSLYSRITESSCIFDVGSVENLHSFATAINMNDTGVKCLISQTGTGVNDYYFIQYISVQKFGGAQMGDRGTSGALKLKYTAADENGLILVASVAAAGDIEGQWLPYNNTMPQDITSYDNLDAIKLDLQSHGVSCQVTKMDVGYVITRSTGVPPYYVTEAYCNAWGGMYVAPAGDRVIEGDRLHVDGDGNNVNVGIDLDGGTISLGDGSALDFTQLIYDEAAKTYYVDTIDQSTNITYNYSWTYHIDYTSITYIGQTEEYNKYYEFYYELPDGRSSADLTAEELEQLNVSIDVLPYIRSTDDVHVRALYHFDGDTRDSSYWNHLSSFEWTDGASITYMDAGVFEGALYLDEQSHRFVITLPKNIASSDFTLQWRMYQSATPAPVSDTSISVGGQMLLKSDGSHWLNNGGTQIASIPVGAWCEYAIVRSSSGLHFFINGLKVYSWSSALANASYTNQLIFNFGDQQQTYKYFDELRVVTKALYSTAGYTPTAVPHDTNLALVLPDSKLPVADAYWSFESSKTNLLEEHSLSNWVNWADGEKPNLIVDNNWNDSSFTVKYDSSNKSAYRYQVYPFFPRISTSYSNTAGKEFPKFWYGLNSTSVFSDTSGTHLSIGGISSSYEYYSPNWSVFTGAYVKRFSENIQYAPTGGMVTYFDIGFADGNFPSTLEAGKTYTLSMVSADGEVGSFTFEMPTLGAKVSGYNAYTISGDQLTPISESQYLTTVSTNGTNYYFANSGYEHFAFVGEYLFNDYYFIVYPAVAEERYAGSSNEYYLPHYIMQIVPVVSSDTYNSTTGRYEGGDFVYLELVEGESDLKAEYVESIAVMDKDDINTPSLAVKTDIEITGHQIGGMRPSVPEKGLVWALVEGGIIKSLQIYNGSAWEAVDGRIWTGSRWVPYSAYNVLLMKDLYDITGTVTPEDYEYIYTESGFWSWLQKWLNDFKTALFGRLDQIIDGSGSDDAGEDSDEKCLHAYAIDFQSDPTCTNPGKIVYSCPLCGDTYTEYVDALDHDWVEQTHVDDSYHLPAGVTCPGCSGTNFSSTLVDKEYSCTCNDCQTIWQEEARVEVGYTIYECSRCGEQRKEHNDSDSNLFEALGNFFADGVEWISDKLQQLVNSLSGISDIFTNMAETIKQYAGDFSGLFGEFLALMPADLMNVVWFGLVITIALVVWKKWFS